MAAPSRTVTVDTAAAINSFMPAFHPAPPKPAAAGPPPKAHIIRLPRYVVEGYRPLQLRTAPYPLPGEQLMPPAELERQKMKKYLNFDPAAANPAFAAAWKFLFQPYAEVMYQQDEQAARASEIADLQRLDSIRSQ